MKPQIKENKEKKKHGLLKTYRDFTEEDKKFLMILKAKYFQQENKQKIKDIL